MYLTSKHWLHTSFCRWFWIFAAVVGAGIGGSATAHFLRQHFGPEVKVDVFEKGEVGGRLATVTVNHHDYESGGSIIHSLNLHMQEFVKQLGWFKDTHTEQYVLSFSSHL